MGQRKSDGDKFFGLVLLALGAVTLYYLKVGSDRENNAALIPDSLEDRIDRVVGALKARFGKNWGDWGAETLKSYLQNTLPRPLVALVNVVSTVEQEARHIHMTSHTKQQRAVTIATARGLA